VSPTGASHDVPTVPPDEPPTGRGGGRRRRRLAFTAVVALIVVAGGTYAAIRGSSPPPLDRAQVDEIASDVVTKAVEDLRSEPAPSAAVYQQILPSLVQIEVESPSSEGDGTGFGAGVIVNARGAILTALHVVEGAESIRVSFVDGTRSAATITSTDAENDIAVLEPERGPEVIVPAVLGGGGQVGEEAYAVGHPLGYVGTLTSGVISALDRSVEGANGATLRGLTQFDAAVNPGNSGGPLLNRSGQVIGIVTALANPSRDGYFIGIGFAVPIGTAGGAANAPPK
jgi:S1-C subfamily serine protease